MSKERATEKQLKMLDDLGFEYSPGITKKAAQRSISWAMAKREEWLKEQSITNENVENAKRELRYLRDDIIPEITPYYNSNGNVDYAFVDMGKSIINHINRILGIIEDE